jgi:carbon-monoxide dehydrogenase medium subunit
MKPIAFKFERAGSVAEAAAALRARENAKVIAGGQSLGPMMNLRLARPSAVVDVARLPGFQQVQREGAYLRVGAAVTHAAIEDGSCATGPVDILSRVARGIAYRAVRNRGTIGGSLVHADPAADWVIVLSTLDASVIIEGEGGKQRQEKLTDFIRSPMTTSLLPTEILSAVLIPEIHPELSFGYYKHCRKVGEFADASAAVMIDGRKHITRVFIGALGSNPRMLPFQAWQPGRHGALPPLETLTPLVAAAVPGSSRADIQMRAVTLQRALSQVSA